MSINVSDFVIGIWNTELMRMKSSREDGWKSVLMLLSGIHLDELSTDEGIKLVMHQNKLLFIYLNILMFRDSDESLGCWSSENCLLFQFRVYDLVTRMD